jgi:hypothetical protein
MSSMAFVVVFGAGLTLVFEPVNLTRLYDVVIR